MNSVFKTRNFVSKSKNFVLKTRNVVLKMMEFAGSTGWTTQNSSISTLMTTFRGSLMPVKCQRLGRTVRSQAGGRLGRSEGAAGRPGRTGGGHYLGKKLSTCNLYLGDRQAGRQRGDPVFVMPH